MTKNLLIALGLIAGSILPGALVAPAQATSPVQSDIDFHIPKDLDAKPDLNQKWVQTSKAAWSLNVTCQLIHAGKGIVTQVAALGAGSDSIALYDSSAVGSLTFAAPDSTKTMAVLSVDSAKSLGFYQFSPGLPYNDGLVMCPNTATSRGALTYIKKRS
jgi:hypothetical protein